MKIDIIPILNDNYTYALHIDSDEVVIVDPGEAQKVIDYLEHCGLRLKAILNTHHHGDHIAGNAALKNRYGCPVIGPAADAHRIPELDQGVTEGEIVTIGVAQFEVIATPGHTSGHISFYLPQAQALFCGDTLFSMGCGRLFEGTAKQMWKSLQKLAELPDDTMVYCGHEYTAANGTFCLSIEPDNQALKTRIAEVKELRNQGQPTIPVSLATEKETNVFLRTGNAARFAELRSLKDQS